MGDRSTIIGITKARRRVVKQVIVSHNILPVYLSDREIDSLVYAYECVVINSGVMNFIPGSDTALAPSRVYDDITVNIPSVALTDQNASNTTRTAWRANVFPYRVTNDIVFDYLRRGWGVL